MINDLSEDRFPDLHVSVEADPFVDRVEWGNPSAQYIYTAALITSGATNLDELNGRLQAVQTAVDSALEGARFAGEGEWLYGCWVIPEEHPGLTASVLGEFDSRSHYPACELHAAMAVWLMVEARAALLVAELDEVNRLVIQASICLAHCFGEGGRSVVENHERAARTERARKAGSSPRPATQERNARMREEFESGMWRSRASAIEALAGKYHLSFDHVDSLMKGIPYRRQP
ncbi:hypothetical protein [Pseudoxanthomonas kaohsiungensis]|uniref:Uncharacterized protein n=1 Tax=Pseudoxanthomonas kaohsiungensis TaxID=283923 RepID=A0ABW3LT47_9GAMM|nr:hypothetical protein [Pseudoxanthomonas kaohsiungensis]